MSEDVSGLNIVTAGNTISGGRYCYIYVPNTAAVVSWTGMSPAIQNAASLTIASLGEINGLFSSVTCVSGGPILVYT